MKWQTIVALVVVIPILALFLGVGILFASIGQTWDASTTSALIAGLVTVCGGGVLVFSLLLALIVGVPLAIRLFAESGRASRAWHGSLPVEKWKALPAPYDWQQAPPLPAATSQREGGVINLGKSQYDVLEESDTADGGWTHKQREKLRG